MIQLYFIVVISNRSYLTNLYWLDWSFMAFIYLYIYWVPTISVLILVKIVAQKRKLLWSFLKMLLSSRHMQSLINCMWIVELSFPEKVEYLYHCKFLLCDIVAIILLWHHYIYKTWSWRTYDYVFSFLLKTGCDIMSSQYSFSNIAFDVFLFITKQSYIIEEMVKTKLWTKLLDVSIRIHTQTIQFVLVI